MINRTSLTMQEQACLDDEGRDGCVPAWGGGQANASGKRIN